MHATGSASVRSALGALGLDRFQGYVWGRAAGLGEPEPSVVVAAFGVFEPERLTRAYEAARAACPRDRMLEVRSSATAESLRRVLGPADLVGAVRVLRRGLSVAPLTARPIFAGLTARPWPDDPYGQLWRACELVREHRGDTHLVACVAHGLAPIEMNVLTELWLGMPLGSYTATRGWSGRDIARAEQALVGRGLVRAGRLTANGMELRIAVESATNRGQRDVADAVGDDLEPLVAALHGWSARCIEAGTFSADTDKRAAG